MVPMGSSCWLAESAHAFRSRASSSDSSHLIRPSGSRSSLTLGASARIPHSSRARRSRWRNSARGRLMLEAQQGGKTPRVGMLVIGSRQQTVRFVDAFEHGMYQLGYVDGRTIVFEHRFANGKAELLADLAAEMVRLNLDVIVTGSNQQTIVAKRVTQAVPIVAMFFSDSAPTPPIRPPNGQLVPHPRPSRTPTTPSRPPS